MSIPSVEIRRGLPDDTEPCFDVFLESVTDLTVRQGNAWEADPATIWTHLAPVYRLLSAQAAEWWVAQDSVSGRLVGYARSVERDGLFELAEFFVRPGNQSAGMGGQLLERAFPADRGEVRAIIATTDVRALARYYRAGTVARFPIVSLSAAGCHPRLSRSRGGSCVCDRRGPACRPRARCPRLRARPGGTELAVRAA